MSEQVTENDGLNSVAYKVIRTEVKQMFTRFYIDLGETDCIFECRDPVCKESHLHTEPWLLSLNSTPGFVYLGRTHYEYYDFVALF